MRTLIEAINEAIYEKQLKVLQAGGLGVAVPDVFGVSAESLKDEVF